MGENVDEDHQYRTNTDCTVKYKINLFSTSPLAKVLQVGLNFVNVYSFSLFRFLLNSPKRKKEILNLGLRRTRFCNKSRSVVVMNFK